MAAVHTIQGYPACALAGGFLDVTAIIVTMSRGLHKIFLVSVSAEDAHISGISGFRTGRLHLFREMEMPEGEQRFGIAVTTIGAGIGFFSVLRAGSFLGDLADIIVILGLTLG
jgi:hypothetical protein